MRPAAAILIIMVMISLWQQAFSQGQSDSRDLGIDLSSHPLPGSAVEKMEERMALALSALSSSAASVARGNPTRNKAGNEPARNSSPENSSNNASLPQNGRLNNISMDSSEINSSLSNQQLDSDHGDGDPGSSPSNRFSGIYATKASRHEIGKAGVDSSFLLSGKFDTEKSIKFQDQGF